MNTTVINTKIAGYCGIATCGQALKESPKTIEKRFEFWNYMTGLSMQNMAYGMMKAA